MMMGAWYDIEEQRLCTERRLQEMRRDAEWLRLARQARQSKHLRRSVGRLLIAAGEALIGHAPEPDTELPMQRPHLFLIRRG